MDPSHPSSFAGLIFKLISVAWWDSSDWRLRSTGFSTDCCGCMQPLADKLCDGVAQHSQRPKHEAQHYGMGSGHSFSAAVHKHKSAAEACLDMLLETLVTVESQHSLKVTAVLWILPGLVEVQHQEMKPRKHCYLRLLQHASKNSHLERHAVLSAAKLSFLSWGSY